MHVLYKSALMLETGTHDVKKSQFQTYFTMKIICSHKTGSSLHINSWSGVKYQKPQNTNLYIHLLPDEWMTNSTCEKKTQERWLSVKISHSTNSHKNVAFTCNLVWISKAKCLVKYMCIRFFFRFEKWKILLLIYIIEIGTTLMSGTIVN